MNQFNAIGRLVRDPETRAIGGGNVSNLNIAINRKWKDPKSGDWKEETLFLKATAWAYLADKASKLSKGQLVFVSGALESRKWQDKEGGNRESIELRLTNLESIVAASAGASDDWRNKGKGGSGAKTSESFDSLDDEIPF